MSVNEQEAQKDEVSSVTINASDINTEKRRKYRIKLSVFCNTPTLWEVCSITMVEHELRATCNLT